MFAIRACRGEPDIMTLAKGLGSGLPIGAIVAKEKPHERGRAAPHGTTFGGNPIALRGSARDARPRPTASTSPTPRRVGAAFHGAGCASWPSDYPCIGEVRGRGLMIGVELDRARMSRRRKVLATGSSPRATTTACCCCPAASSTVRFMPPLCGYRGRGRRGDDLLRAVARRGAGEAGLSDAPRWAAAPVAALACC